jgi:mannose-6-phosphate isomerase-like protein (cupin superfamily)
MALLTPGSPAGRRSRPTDFDRIGWRKLGMKDVKVVRLSEVKSSPLPGTSVKNAGWMKRVVYPHNAGAKGVFLGVVEAKPGYSPHRWHSHIKDKAKGYEVVYPKGFEEIYYIVSGRGVVQWRTEKGGMKEERVRAGDVIFLPRGVAEHQVFNNGTKKMIVVFCGSPPPKVTLTK